MSNKCSSILIVRKNDLCWKREQCLYFTEGGFNLGSLTPWEHVQNSVWTRQCSIAVSVTGFSHMDQGFYSAIPRSAALEKWPLKVLDFWMCWWLKQKFLHTETLATGSVLWQEYPLLAVGTQTSLWQNALLVVEEAKEIRLLKLWTVSGHCSLVSVPL